MKLLGLLLVGTVAACGMLAPNHKQEIPVLEIVPGASDNQTLQQYCSKKRDEQPTYPSMNTYGDRCV